MLDQSVFQGLWIFGRFGHGVVFSGYCLSSPRVTFVQEL